MLKTFAMCLGLGAAGAMLAAALKWAGALRVPIEFLYGFYDQSPAFEKIHGSDEFALGQIALLLLAAVATAWVIAGIPHVARRLVIVLGAVLITFFLSPVLALMGWKLEPFSWLVSIASAAISLIVVFPVLNSKSQRAADREEAERRAAPVPSTAPTRLMRTPEMALAAAEKAAAATARQDLESKEQSAPDVREPGIDIKDETDPRTEASMVTVEVFPPQRTVEGYSGCARAFLERACTFLRSAGAGDAEQGPSFVRVVFLSNKEETEPHGHARLASEAALLLNGHLQEFCDASESESIGALRYGIALESFAWMSASKELPVSSSDVTQSLCRLNRRYGSHVVIGARAHRLTGTSIEVRPLELIEDPDSGSPCEVYELLGAAGTLPEDELIRRDAFWEGVVCLRTGNNDEAIARFQRARIGEDHDPVLDYFEAVSRGEKPDDDFTYEDTDDDDGIDVIPVAYYRESDSEDRMETFIDVDDTVETPVVPEKS